MSFKHYQTPEEQGARHRHPQRRRRSARKRRLRTIIKVALVVSSTIIVLGAIFFLNALNNESGGSGSATYPYVVANPGQGQQAPAITLPATSGTTFDLAAQHGKTVLLFFQEGLSCEPCWTQIKDIETNWSGFKSLDLNEMVSITTDPLDALKQKVADEGITTLLLSDQSFAVSQTYNANEYGMMSGSADGHTFIVIGPDGRIKWRADYGGPPNYTMYVPISTLLANMKAGLHERTV